MCTIYSFHTAPYGRLQRKYHDICFIYVYCSFGKVYYKTYYVLRIHER
jgi:hypothetical protein